MIQALPVRIPPLVPYRFKRHFETKDYKIRVFGPCEATGRHFEITVPAEGFFIYLQGFKTIENALNTLTDQERMFILNGIAPAI